MVGVKIYLHITVTECGCVQIVRLDRTMEQIVFPVPNICEFLTQESKLRVYYTTERDEQGSKINDFFLSSEDLFNEMNWQKKLRGTQEATGNTNTVPCEFFSSTLLFLVFISWFICCLLAIPPGPWETSPLSPFHTYIYSIKVKSLQYVLTCVSGKWRQNIPARDSGNPSTCNIFQHFLFTYCASHYSIQVIIKSGRAGNIKHGTSPLSVSSASEMFATLKLAASCDKNPTAVRGNTTTH